jgi:N-acetylmuramoyl-L-alanine amidase
VLRPVYLWFGVLLLAAGCSTLPPRVDPNKPLPANWDSDLGPHYAAEPDVKLPTRPPPTAPPGVTLAVPAMVTTAESSLVSLNRWATQNGFGALRVVPLQPVPAHAVITPRGKFVVQPGSLRTFWDGLEVRLGFAPQLIGDQIFLHVLDIKKVLEPLVQGFSILTPSNRTVVIDAGHGGLNAGTRSVVDGRWEKEFTLDWALQLAPLLEQRGWRVVLTRTNDMDLSLPDRVAIAEAAQADLFLSLHFNSAGEGREQAGLESYCLTPTGMPSSLVRNGEDDVRQTFPNNAFDADNLRYAVRLHRALLPVTGNLDRGVRHARFPGVLRGQNRPAVLIEGGYLSNPAEARRIADPAHLQKLAEAVAKALE